MQTFLPFADYGRRHHPAVLMWKGYEEALGRYAFTCCEVWAELAESGLLPPWLGDEDFHRSHHSSLLRKDPDHYRPQFDDVPDDLEYVWPVRRNT